MIASEPLSSLSDDWLEVPRNHLLRVRHTPAVVVHVSLLQLLLTGMACGPKRRCLAI